MALLNGLYIHVTDETVSREMTVPSHPVEDGVGVTDSVRLDPIIVTLKGKIVDYKTTDGPGLVPIKGNGVHSYQVLTAIKNLADSGAYVEYSGRNTFYDNKYYGFVIRRFNTSHVNTIHGGCDFEMELQEVRVAQSSYKKGALTNTGTQQVTQGTKTAVYHQVKRGDTVWNLVHVVYKSLNTSVDWVIEHNKDAFGGNGDPHWLKSDARLLMGYR